jgi:arylsulfatase A-like enzyme
MGRRWWLLFRSLAVITVLFLAPILAVRKIPLRYFLSTGDLLAHLALEIAALLLLEALIAAFFTVILSAGHALKPWDVQADDDWAGFLALASALICLLVLVSPFGDSIVNASLSVAVIVAVIGAVTYFGWRPAFALLNRLNQSAQIVLAVCPLLLLIPILTGGFGWRSFDSIPPPQQFTPNPAAGPNVVLISFDALAAQDMSLYGYSLPTTPQFDRLARRSYNFVNFFSTSDFTSPAAASLLTGQYPLTHRVFQLYGHVPKRLREHNLAWLLRQRGYTTAAIVTNPAANPLVLRVADSFSILPRPPVFWWFFPGTFLLQLRNGALTEAADSLMAIALRNFGCLFDRFNRARWVDPRAVFASARDFVRGAPAPYFLWIHVYPPHAPYVTDARFQGRFLAGSEFTTQAQFFWQSPPQDYPPEMQPKVDLLRLRYDESVAECDSALGEFLDWMAAGHRDSNTVMIVTADHGENFSGGYWTHDSPDLHYAETHIPLLISLPGQSRSYTETEDGDLSDVAPTILAALGIGKPSWMEGHDLIGAAQVGAPSEPAFSMYLAKSSAFSRPAIGAIAANSGPYHLVWYFPAGRIALFDIARDPGETTYVASTPGVAMPLVMEIKRRFGDELDCGPPVCGP